MSSTNKFQVQPNCVEQKRISISPIFSVIFKWNRNNLPRTTQKLNLRKRKEEKKNFSLSYKGELTIFLLHFVPMEHGCTMAKKLFTWMVIVYFLKHRAIIVSTYRLGSPTNVVLRL